MGKERIAEAWNAPQHILDHLWNSDIQNRAGKSTLGEEGCCSFYWACNNGNGLHLGSDRCNWVWRRNAEVEVLVGDYKETHPELEKIFGLNSLANAALDS